MRSASGHGQSSDEGPEEGAAMRLAEGAWLRAEKVFKTLEARGNRRAVASAAVPANAELRYSLVLA